MDESIFIAEGDRFLPTEQARGPWNPRALHGGAPAALMTAAFERHTPGEKLRIGRLSFEFLRPVPLAPLELRTRIVRPGRRVQELLGELYAGEELIVRGSAMRVQEVPGAALAAAQPAAQSEPEQPLPAPSHGKPARFSLDGSSEASFAASAMEMRWLSEPAIPGPGRVWMRLRHPLLPGEPLTALTRLAATADFGNGVSAPLPFERFLFINADLTVHLQRPPTGEWIGLDARTLLHGGGTGLAEGVLHDEDGPLGRSFQTLVIQER